MEEGMIKNMRMCDLVTCRMLFGACTLFALVLACGSLTTVSAQGSGSWAITQAQEAVRQRINNRERGNNQAIRFNRDTQTEVRSSTVVHVSGTGTFSDNSGSYNNAGRRREFSYEALVSNRNRNRGRADVSDVRYDLRDAWSGNGRDNNDRRGESGVNDNRGRGNNNDNPGGGGYRGGPRPDGRVSYSGPIMNRHSDKGLDVADQSTRDGANIQQWSFADQPNQNWNVIDLGNGDVAILSQHSGMAITVQGGRDQNGANIIQRTWNNSRQQRWRLEQVGGDFYRIVSVDNGKVLDVSEAGKENGASIHLWDYVNKANQQWRLRRER